MYVKLTKSEKWGESYTSTYLENGESISCHPVSCDQESWERAINDYKNNENINIEVVNENEVIIRDK